MAVIRDGRIRAAEADFGLDYIMRTTAQDAQRELERVAPQGLRVLP